MAEWEVGGSVSWSFTCIIPDAKSEEDAIAQMERDKVQFFLDALEQGDLPDESDVDVEFANQVKDEQ